MKTIILCAGRGKRLKKWTKDVPKCLIKIGRKTLLELILNNFFKAGFTQKDIVLVVGYKNNKIREFLFENHLNDILLCKNPIWSSSNMVYSFLCAREYARDGCIVSYSDIIYKSKIIEKILSLEDDIAIPYYKNWLYLWNKRFKDPLQDAETFKKDKDGYILEIGKKPRTYDEIQGQYMGIVKFSPKGFNVFSSLFNELSDKNIDFTSMLNNLINQGMKIRAVEYGDIFFEIDTDIDKGILSEKEISFL